MKKPKRAKKAAEATREPVVLVLSREEYFVDGGSVRDGMVGAIELIGPTMLGTVHPSRRAVTLFIPRGELQFYPIGAKVRVTVERLK